MKIRMCLIKEVDLPENQLPALLQGIRKRGFETGSVSTTDLVIQAIVDGMIPEPEEWLVHPLDEEEWTEEDFQGRT